MKRYISHKIVEAAEVASLSDDMTSLIYLVDGNMQSLPVDPSMFVRFKPEKGDYVVRYADGYVSFSPKKAFEEGYRLLPEPGISMSFGDAIDALKRGERVARIGWNGKNMFLWYVAAWRGDGTEEMPQVTTRSLPFIAMYTANNSGFVPWLASQTDMLSSDWEIVP